MFDEMVHCIFRNRFLMGIKVEPKLVDIFSYQNLKYEYIYPYSFG